MSKSLIVGWIILLSLFAAFLGIRQTLISGRDVSIYFVASISLQVAAAIALIFLLWILIRKNFLK